MKIQLLVAISLFAIFSGCALNKKGESITIESKLQHGFAKIVAVSGEYVQEDLNRFKGEGKNVYFLVKSVNGQDLPLPTRIELLPFSTFSEKELFEGRHDKKQVSFIGYESFWGTGSPKGIDAYVPSIQDRGWRIWQYFVVLKLISNEEARKAPQAHYHPYRR
ncbi:MAG: hypothetical protein LBV28_04335 [Puniceicoccales bacterium]|jgi:hypothetical protein|nr:hypothetical protein [Puniceicoccales bacterium]